MAAASLVLGIISVVLAVFVSGYGWVASILGVIGIILASVAKKKAKSGVATAGLVLSIIGLSLGLLFYIACVACVSAVAGAL